MEKPKGEASSQAKVWAKKDYYEVLGVAKDAKNAEIKKAYYKLARVYHPDSSDDADAEEIFKVVNEAYHVLIDDQKRAAYDKYGRDGVSQDGMMNPVDIMKSMFGGDAYEDTFGELNMWETIRLQLLMSTGAEMTPEEANARLEKFAKERQAKLVQRLLEKLEPFVKQELEKFKERIDLDIEAKVAAPGGVALMAAIGYVYCQVAQQYMDKYLGIGSLFAKVAEKGHRFKNNMSALSAAVKLTVSAVKLQSKMEEEERERQRKWAAEHPGKLPHGITADNYPFEDDERWRAYERNVEVPAGADRAAALAKVKAKWFEANVAPHVATAEEGGFFHPEGGEGDMPESDDTMKVFDQGLKLMWKLGVMEAEEICRVVCREVCDPKSDLNVASNPSKETLKRRVMALHHIGEKFKAVAARLKKDEKKGFTVQDFLDGTAQQQATSPRPSGNDNNAPLNPQPETTIVDEPTTKPNKTEDVD